LPEKRYIRQAIDDKSGAYLGEDTTYRRVVEHQDQPTVYEHPPAGHESSAALAPSTVWRWLSWLGGLENTLREARELIHKKHPSAALHRESWSVDPRKYQSEARRRVLEQALGLLVVAKLFERAFSKSIFPNLATGCGWS
jgi:hypothetical protein